MNDDELFGHLRRARPDVEAVVRPPDGPEAAALMEQIMTTPTEFPVARPEAGRRRWWFAGVAGLAAVAVAAIAVLSLGGGSDPAVVATYDLGSSDPTLTSCLPVAEIVPPAGTEAFGGTVESIVDGIVTLAVDTWFVGGPADLVQLDGTASPMVALDGVEFVVGQRYLVSIWDGVVGVCGTSGPATPELQQQFDIWFA
jgi:hypothetical protein